jgi:hypothetical protein
VNALVRPKPSKTSISPFGLHLHTPPFKKHFKILYSAFYTTYKTLHAADSASGPRTPIRSGISKADKTFFVLFRAFALFCAFELFTSQSTTTKKQEKRKKQESKKKKKAKESTTRTEHNLTQSI